MRIGQEWILEPELEYSLIHRSPDEEIDFLLAVCNGNMDAVHKNCREHRFLHQEGVGKLSANPLTNIKYHFIVTATLICRLCITKGMDAETSFCMSDYYIMKMDKGTSIQQIESIHNKMVLDYCGRMHLIHQHAWKTKAVNDCISYIYAHITEPLGINEIASSIGISPSYLSHKFSQEVGVSVSDFIRTQKLEKAKELLKYSDLSFVEIANQLSFSSQSHFIQKFKDFYGETPKKYREEHFRKDWGGLSDGTSPEKP